MTASIIQDWLGPAYALLELTSMVSRPRWPFLWRNHDGNCTLTPGYPGQHEFLTWYVDTQQILASIKVPDITVDIEGLSATGRTNQVRVETRTEPRFEFRTNPNPVTIHDEQTGQDRPGICLPANEQVQLLMSHDSEPYVRITLKDGLILYVAPIEYDQSLTPSELLRMVLLLYMSSSMPVRMYDGVHIPMIDLAYSPPVSELQGVQVECTATGHWLITEARQEVRFSLGANGSQRTGRVNRWSTSRPLANVARPLIMESTVLVWLQQTDPYLDPFLFLGLVGTDNMANPDRQ
ncbi:MAG: hypothetical protein ACOCXQ_03625 [Patescibacteria group bacterium]